MLVSEEKELLESNLKHSTGIYTGILKATEENEAGLEDLLNAENELREKIRELQAQMKDKRALRAVLNNKEKVAKRDLEADEVKLKQFHDQQSKEDTKLENFKAMADFANSKEYAWTKMALPHQWQGALQLAHYGSALLADTMGLGKTFQSLAWLDLLSCGNEELGAKKVLIICPDAMVSNFVQEIKDFAPHRTNVVPLSGANNIGRSFAKMAVENYDNFVIVSNYDAVRNNDMQWLADHNLDAVIIDEAHNTNNVDGATFASIRALNSKHYLPMTATFILNKPQDIYGSLNLIMPKIFSDKDKFLSTYCVQGYDNKWTFQDGGEKALMDNLGGRIVKRNYEEAGITLPPMIKQDVMIPMEELSLEQYDVYRQITQYSEIALPDGDGAGIESVIALITRQRQAACYPAGITVKVTQSMYDRMTMLGAGCEPVGTILLQIPESVPSIKVTKATERITKAVANGHRTVVFSQFKTALKGLEKSLSDAGLRVARYDGETKKDQAIKIKQDFKRKPDGAPYDYDVVLVNYKSGGVGLTFTAATYLLKIDEEWNPGKNDQAEARIHRIGQTEPVLVETMLIEDQVKPIGDSEMNLNSIDKWMRELNEHKAAMIGGLDALVYETNLRDSYRNFLVSKDKPQEKAKPKPKPKKIADIDLDFEL